MPDWTTEKRKLQQLKTDASVEVKQKKRKKRKGKVEAKAQPVKKVSRRDILDCMQARSYSRHRGAIRQR